MNDSSSLETVSGVAIQAKKGPRYEEILSPAALSFLAELHRSFDKRRRELLATRNLMSS